jgi:rhodanese-related sulfurtransferase
MKTIDATEVRRRLTAADEIALIDVREEGVFSKSHIFFGSCIPLSHLEFRAPVLVPRETTPVVLVDADGAMDGLAARASDRLVDMGYNDVTVLDGGITAWKAAGHELFSGVNVPSKAFGEFIEHAYDTPRIAPQDLAAKLAAGENIVILDSRPFGEFNRMSIPGGIDCPGAELAYRVGMMAPDPEITVVVNCAGRTRSIIGAQSLINAGIPNRVMALKDGTMGWELAGLTCAHGETEHAPAPEGETLDQAIARAEAVARRFGVVKTTATQLAAWRADISRTTFLLDVRTIEEYEAGHWPGARHAAGGQLVQATDEYVGVKNARIVLADNTDAVRATMTASWLVQLGHPEIYVLAEEPPQPETGRPRTAPALFAPFTRTITATELADPATVIDLADSLTFRNGHIPGAKWAVRSRLAEWVDNIPGTAPVVLTSPDGLLAHYTAHDLAAARPDLYIAVLDGGTNAWRDTGHDIEDGIGENALTAIDDIWWKPYENQGGGRVRQQMEDYLTWEVGLVEQVERDRLARFRIFD